jgi:hypothetical protein
MADGIIPETDAIMMARALGLLVSQAGVYGAQHNVTQSAVRSVFVDLEQALKKYGPVEFAATEGRLLMNGAERGAVSVAGKNLSDRMALYKVGGILFSPPLDLREFLFFVGLFGTPPLTLAGQGGFEAVLKREGLRSIQAVSVSYQRVSGDAPAPAPETSKSRFFSIEAAVPKAAEPTRPALPKSGVIDLSAALGGAAPLNTGREGDNDFPRYQAENSSAATHRQRAQALAAMLRDAAAALEQGTVADVGAASKNVKSVLGQIHETLVGMTEVSRREISTLASQVEEDSKTIDSIESAARRRGIGLKLTRGELVQRYAELNQEIVQPLTVSSGVIDLLHSGKTGAMTQAQLDLLKMALESMDRVSQLVKYLNHVSGLPDSLTPDSQLISDTYR